MKKKQLETLLYSIVGVAVLFLIVIAVNYIAGVFKARADLTEEKLYTLSSGTKAILKSLPGTVEIRFYSTQSQKSMPVQLKAYAQRVEDLLGEYRQHANGKIEIHKFNPTPDSDAEDSANLDGVEGQTLPNGEDVYLGLAVSYLDQKAALPFLAPEREKLLEYDISRALSRVITPEKPVIGILSPLPIFGTPMNPMMARMGQQAQEPWVFVNELKNDFEVKEVATDTDQIPDDVKVLVLVHPKDISDKTEYAIDQFIMRGGKLLAFLDPMSLLDRPANPNPMMPSSGTPSNLPKLLKAWGLQFDTTKVVADLNFARELSTQRGAPPQLMPAFLFLDPRAINKEDVTTSQLDNLLLPFAGAFSGTPAEGLKQTILLKSTTQSQLVESFMAQMAGPTVVKDFKPSGTEYTLALRLQGKFKTAFPDGQPADKEAKDNEKPEDKAKDEQKEETPAADSLKESKRDNVVVLVGDSDMLYDQFCVQIQNFLGQRIVIPRNQNLNLLQNLVEELAGNENLIGARSRATLNRPFTVISEMQAKAQENYQTKIKDLETKLSDTQKRLNELQSQKQGNQRFILSPEQQAEVEKFKSEEARVKKELKDVRKQLRQNIDSLENRLKWFNIAGMPVLVILVGLAMAFVKRQRVKQS